MCAFTAKVEWPLRGRVVITAIFCVALAQSISSANAPIPRAEPSKVLPSELGGFHVIGSATEIKPGTEKDALGSTAPRSIADRTYEADDGIHLRVSLLEWETDSAAYASFTTLRNDRAPDSESKQETVGTASSLIDLGIVFFKGNSSVKVMAQGREERPRAVEFARLLAARLDKGEDEIPVLVKHLPNWETEQRTAYYSVDANQLHWAVRNQPVLDAISFEGGTEAVAAGYGQSQLLIVEFTTPQFSIDNDSRIWTQIAELKSKGEPTPTAYRRVGNYSVFVFNAPDERSANALVDQVKYEQVVQWLGDDPHLYERLQRYFTQTSAGVLVAVLKSSGLSLLLCLAAGALIGAMMFRHRRAQKATMYSDAGGSIRLNLDELTGPANTSRLLKSANSSEQESSNP
jgi:hypothetical protein